MKYTTLQKFWAFAAVIGATTSLATVAAAQPPPRPGGPPQGRPGMRGPGGPGGFGGPGMQGGGRGGFPGGRRQMTAASLSVETLDAIVKLNAGQKAKITQIHDGFVKSMTGMRPPQGQRPDPAMMQKFTALNTQTSQSIEAVLTGPQQTKLAAAMKELALYRMARIPNGLYGQIQLTATQKAGLLQLQQSVSGPGANREARTAAREKAAALLTPAQKAQIDKYRKDHPNEGGGRRAAGP